MFKMNGQITGKNRQLRMAESVPVTGDAFCVVIQETGITALFLT